MELKQIIKNAINAAKRDGYNQVIYTDENNYAFSRNYPLNNMYKKENIIGYIIIKWINGVLITKYINA